MIALVPEPISATVDGQPVMIIGFDAPNRVLAVYDEGQLGWVQISQVKIDWRYNWATGTWIDVGPYDEDEYGTTEASDDRGEEVSGDIPDPDTADGGREVVRPDRADWPLDPGEEDTEGAPV